MAGTWRRRWLVLAAVAASGMGAWLALRAGTTADEGTSALPERSVLERAATGPLLEGTTAARPPRTGRGALTGRVTREGRATSAQVQVLWRAEAAAADLRTQATTPGVLSRFVLPPPSEGRVTTLTTDAEGRFEARALAPGVYEVRATTDDGARGQAGVLVPVDGARVQVEIAIASASGVLRGHIRHADGSPYRGSAFVRTHADEDAPWPVSLGAPLDLDASGGFEARGLLLGPAHVQVVDPAGVWVRGPRVTLPTSEPYVLTLGAEPGRVGRVLARDDGTPISGAIVIGSAYPAGESSLLLHTTTDAEGRWRLALPAQGLYAVRAQAPGFAMLRLEREDLPAAGRPIELRLAREAVLVGRVIAAKDGRPVPGVSVRVLPQYGRGEYFASPPTQSDAQGRYEVRGLPPGSALALAEGAGWAPARLGPSSGQHRIDDTLVDLRAGKVTTRDLVVEPTGRLRGRVLDIHGTPLPGAVVHGQGREGTDSYDSSGAAENLRPAPVTTDAQGAFEMPGLAPSAAYVLVAHAPDGTLAHSEAVRLGPEPQEPVEIRFGALRPLTVRVEDEATGAPLVGAYVTTSGDREDAPYVPEVDRGWSTRADGSATVQVEAGVDLGLSVSTGTHGGVENIRVAADQATVLVRLKRRPLVTGRVLQEDGEPARAEIQAYAKTPKGWTRREWVQTRWDGTFHLEGSGAVPLRLRASAVRADGLFVGEAEGLPDGPPVTLTLQPIAQVPPAPGVLRVRVLDPAGAPVPEARLEVEGPGGGSDVVRHGWAELLAPGWEAGTIVVSHATDADGIALPVGPGRLGPLDAARQEVEVRLPPELVIEGILRTAAGEGVSGAQVEVYQSEKHGGSGRGVGPDAWTDAQGRFRVGSLGPGPHDLHVTTRAHGWLKVSDVVAGRRDVVIALGTGAQATITVLDEADRPVAQALVRARDGDESRVIEAWTDARGQALLTGLPKDQELELSVGREADPGGAERHATIEAWRPADTTVRLPTLRVVRGRVVDPQGRQVADADVFALIDGATYWASVDDRGRFRVVVDVPGDIVIRLHDSGEPPVQARFTGEDVVLVLPRGLELLVHVEGWVGLEPSVGEASLVPQASENARRRDAAVDATGVARFERLERDTLYTLWVPPRADGRSLLLRDVSPTAGPLRVALREGRSIRGRVVMPAGAQPFSLKARKDGVEVAGTLSSDGTYAILGLPEGRWLLTLIGESSDAIITRDAVVEAGGTHDFDLTQAR